MKIAIATDHRGIEIKKELVEYLINNKYEIIDCSKNNNQDDDYPDYAFKVCKEINNNNADLGILICGSGIGMSIAANKVKGIRCAKVDNVNDATLCRKHNGANVIALRSDLAIEDAQAMIEAFLITNPAEEERHIRRINKIIAYENGAYNEL